MKRVLFSLFTFLIVSTLHAQQLSVIQLSQPDKTRGKSLMAALDERKSTREFSTEKLSTQDLSDLLWAAWGINREDGRRTAPSALNKQDVDVYVVMHDGVYVYDAKAHALTPVAYGDHRSAVAGSQNFAKDAPVSLVLISDLKKFGATITEHTKLMAAVNIGVISENINLFCAANNLVTVPRAFMDTEKLREILKLSENHLILMNNPVGYPKK
ncbi:MAG: SagB/ThcOx family dehydrogenase [Tannerellaceae bacterium]|nr:SagB/ThcOx family dehydrogenase [Tannerellaceae bacterium]